MKIQIEFSTSFGSDVYLPYPISGTCEVDVNDKELATLSSAINEDDVVADTDLYDIDIDLYNKIDRTVQGNFYNLLVIDGWENNGWEACSEDPFDLMEQDKRNGDFTPAEGLDEYEENQLWQKHEEKKLAEMDVAEKAAYLQGHYGLDTDTDGVYCGWIYEPEIV